VWLLEASFLVRDFVRQHFLRTTAEEVDGRRGPAEGGREQFQSIGSGRQCKRKHGHQREAPLILPIRRAERRRPLPRIPTKKSIAAVAQLTPARAVLILMPRLRVQTQTPTELSIMVQEIQTRTDLPTVLHQRMAMQEPWILRTPVFFAAEE
jgi:hypothetical protein